MSVTPAVAVPSAKVIRLPTGQLTIEPDPASLCQDFNTLIGFGARNNAKRGFLFVSRVLGKHLPVSPARMQAAHEALAELIPTTANDRLMFIGMAETATGLGQGVFEAFHRMRPSLEASYVQTTRYWMDSDPITFEESHSHAPSQCLHETQDLEMARRTDGANVLVLVDDELSTGRTFANLVQAYRARYPNIERVHLVALCDFSNGEARQRVVDVCPGSVTSGCLVNGRHHFEPATAESSPGLQPPAAAQVARHAPAGLTGAFGRRPIDHPLTIHWDDLDVLAALRPKDEAITRVRVIGTGEFMHMAFVIGRFLSECGADVTVQSTTRSPILTGVGAIASATPVADHYGEGVPNFLYNDDSSDALTLVCCEGPSNVNTRAIVRALGGVLLECHPDQRSGHVRIAFPVL